MSHSVHLKLGRRFYALLKVCLDRDDTVPLRGNIPQKLKSEEGGPTDTFIHVK